MEHRNRFREIDSASPCSSAGRYENRVDVLARQAGNRFLGSSNGLQIRALAGRYDNPIPTRRLAPIDCLKIPAQPSSMMSSILILKGIDRPFRRGVKSSLIRSLFINWRLGNFFLLILKGFHHKISKKPIDAA